MIDFLEALPIEQACSVTELAVRFGLTEKQAASRVKAIYKRRPDLVGKVVDIVPPAEVVIRLVQQQIAEVNGDNVMDFNSRCRQVIAATVLSRNRQYIKALLRRLGLSDDAGILTGHEEVLINALLDEETGIADHLKAMSNGLVSLAGGVNEAILLLGLENQGLVFDRDFTRTGKNSVADFVIYGPERRQSMYVEVKSFKARERLLRGLQDIHYPDKIGVGFFMDPSEFNDDRTVTLLAAGPLAIYMPDSTLAAVSAEAKRRVTRQGNVLYRGLSTFFHDMAAYNNAGQLPEWR